MNYRDKSLIDKILRKEKLTQHDKKELISLLSKLPTDELILLLGNEFKKHTQNYIKWGWDYDQSLKRVILNNFFFSNKQNKDRNDEYYKKCSFCEKILPIKNFEKYGSERGKKGGIQSYRSTCKECRRKRKSIRELRKKLKLILEFFEAKCNECNLSVIYLPSFEFHHVDILLKKSSWRDMNYKSYKSLSKWVINEKVIPLCGNCHLKKQAKYFNEFRELILKENLFSYSQEILDELIDKAIKNHPIFKNVQEKSKIKYQIKRWIRKRYVLEQLYNSQCVVCGVDAIKNLPSIVFHHIIESLKKSTWQDLQDLDCVDIMNKLIKEKCISLCSNCHSVLHSNYHDNFKMILQDLYTENEIKDLTINLDKIIIKANNKISNFKFNLEKVNFKSPLKYNITQNDIWKIQTLKVYLFSKENKKEMFRIKELINMFNKNYHNAYEIIHKLLKMGYLKKIIKEGRTQTYYIFTGKGIKKVNELQQKFMHLIGNSLEKQIKIKYRQPDSHRMENDDIFDMYPKIIIKIIKDKGYNEFLIKDLVKEIGRTSGHISKILREKLIPNGYVKVKSPPYIAKVRGSTKVYSLTDEILESFKL